MTPQPPSLRQEIEAVEWALRRLDEQALRDDEIETMRPRLKAAVETLKTWEFAQEVLN